MGNNTVTTHVARTTVQALIHSCNHVELHTLLMVKELTFYADGADADSHGADAHGADADCADGDGTDAMQLLILMLLVLASMVLLLNFSNGVAADGVAASEDADARQWHMCQEPIGAHLVKRCTAC
jgi:hypothetical protein